MGRKKGGDEEEESERYVKKKRKREKKRKRDTSDIVDLGTVEVNAPKVQTIFSNVIKMSGG